MLGLGKHGRDRAAAKEFVAALIFQFTDLLRRSKAMILNLVPSRRAVTVRVLKNRQRSPLAWTSGMHISPALHLIFPLTAPQNFCLNYVTPKPNGKGYHVNSKI